ncbi:hypothetical protein, partial [Kocuria rhizophila]|uniref:hypothetical protein n=1 Tax=Kocuria rhizophila TaxID=72000 RepID=UPI001F3801A0
MARHTPRHRAQRPASRTWPVLGAGIAVSLATIAPAHAAENTPADPGDPLGVPRSLLPIEPCQRNTL